MQVPEGVAGGWAMSDDDAEFLRSWPADSRQVTIRLVEDPQGQIVHEVWVADLGPGAPGDDDTRILGALLQATRAPGEPPPPHVLSTRRVYFSWGADASSIQYVLELAAAGILGGAAYDMVKQGIQSTVQRLRAPEADGGVGPLTESEASERARWKLLRAFDLTESQVGELREVAHSVSADGAHTVSFEFADQRYDVDLEHADNLVTVVRWSRADKQL